MLSLANKWLSMDTIFSDMYKSFEVTLKSITLTMCYLNPKYFFYCSKKNTICYRRLRHLRVWISFASECLVGINIHVDGITYITQIFLIFFSTCWTLIERIGVENDKAIHFLVHVILWVYYFILFTIDLYSSGCFVIY